MKIFLSAVEQGPEALAVKELIEQNVPMRWNLISYYYAKDRIPFCEQIRDHSEGLMVDSGAHSFQHALQGKFQDPTKAKSVDWEAYTREYARFIKDFDRDNVYGYFKMDIDGIIGYDNVKKLRKIIEIESGVPHKIIPVWHNNRGAKDFVEMCQEYAGRIVAVSGFKNFDIKDHQYLLFLKTARKYGCKLHALGMTRKGMLDSVPFDFVDSASWVMNAVYGRVGSRRVPKNQSKTNRTEVFKQSYLHWKGLQDYYYRKWNGV